MDLTRRDALRMAAVPALLALAGDPRRLGGLRLAWSDVRRSAGDPDAVPEAVASVHALAAGLFGALADRSADNLALSPWSVAMALAMAATGARGRTRREMLGVLAAADVRVLDAGLNALDHRLEGLAGPVRGGDGEIVLDSADALFGQRGVHWEGGFLDALARDFGAGMQVVDFVRDRETAADLVNAWTAERTHDKIPQIVPPGALAVDTRLVLVNALYLKAPWAEPFPGEQTADADFQLLDGSTVPVSTMHVAVVAGHAVGDGWQAVQIPYAGGRLAMSVVLPAPGRLGDVTELVGGGGLPGMLAAMTRSGVDLALPRWRLRSDVSLGEVLAALGCATAFDSREADFSGMTRDQPLFISKVLHQAYVAVDEEGTEAAAATAVEMRTTAGVAVSVSVRVDRPFLFVVHDVEQGVPLFLGRVTDPRG